MGGVYQPERSEVPVKGKSDKLYSGGASGTYAGGASETYNERGR